MKASKLLRRYGAGESDFSNADLRGADLRCANLTGANLVGADLSGAKLTGADLSGTNLCGADLSRTNLEQTDFRGAKLSGTILNRTAPLPILTDDEIRAAGLEPDQDGARVWGWRMAQSQHVGNTNYVPRRAAYEAPVLSRDIGTCCHLGIYISNLQWLYKQYGNLSQVIRCYCRRDELVLISNKSGGRCRRLWVPKGAQPPRGATLSTL